MEIDWWPIDLTQARKRAKAKIMQPNSPELTLQWPNSLGAAPVDAIGKYVNLASPLGEQLHRVLAVSGEKLILEPAENLNK